MVITDDEIGKGLAVLKVIWFAMFGSLALYWVVGLQVATAVQISLDADIFTLLKSVFYVLAVVTLIFIRFIRKLILSSKGRVGQANPLSRPPYFQNTQLP